MCTPCRICSGLHDPLSSREERRIESGVVIAVVLALTALALLIVYQSDCQGLWKREVLPFLQSSEGVITAQVVTGIVLLGLSIALVSRCSQVHDRYKALSHVRGVVRTWPLPLIPVLPTITPTPAPGPQVEAVAPISLSSQPRSAGGGATGGAGSGAPSAAAAPALPPAPPNPFGFSPAELMMLNPGDPRYALHFSSTRVGVHFKTVPDALFYEKIIPYLTMQEIGRSELLSKQINRGLRNAPIWKQHLTTILHIPAGANSRTQVQEHWQLVKIVEELSRSEYIDTDYSVAFCSSTGEKEEVTLDTSSFQLIMPDTSSYQLIMTRKADIRAIIYKQRTRIGYSSDALVLRRDYPYAQPFIRCGHRGFVRALLSIPNPPSYALGYVWHDTVCSDHPGILLDLLPHRLKQYSSSLVKGLSSDRQEHPIDEALREAIAFKPTVDRSHFGNVLVLMRVAKHIGHVVHKNQKYNMNFVEYGLRRSEQLSLREIPAKYPELFDEL